LLLELIQSPNQGAEPFFVTENIHLSIPESMLSALRLLSLE